MHRCLSPSVYWRAVCTTLLVAPIAHAAPKHPIHSPRSAKSAPAHAQSRSSQSHHHPKRHSDAVFLADAESTPAYRYAQLDVSSCYAEVNRRQLPLRREAQSWRGISAPMRFTGPVNGIVFRTDIPAAERSSSPFELFDCRLALALDDFSKVLRAAGITEVVLSSAYRPPPKSASEHDEQGKRHAGGLAVDVHRMAREDGTWFKVDRDFHGRIGAKVCGKSAPHPAMPEAVLLRRLVCDASEQHLFQSILTPNYDRPHHNHFHFELTPGVKWFIVS